MENSIENFYKHLEDPIEIKKILCRLNLSYSFSKETAQFNCRYDAYRWVLSDNIVW
jgi:hypothetical protein